MKTKRVLINGVIRSVPDVPEVVEAPKTPKAVTKKKAAKKK